MSQWLPKFRPYRCMRGASVGAAPVTNHATGALYNNSKGDVLLAVLAVAPFFAGGNSYCQLFSLKGTIGSPAGASAPLVTNEAPLPGVLYSSDEATLGTPDFVQGNAFGPSGTMISGIPYAILQPGWSFVMQEADTAGFATFGFIWQAVHPQDLDGRHCASCDPYTRIVGGHAV